MSHTSETSDIAEQVARYYEQHRDEMVHYVTSNDTCRSRMLLSYFGETDAPDCGQCDVCIGRKKAGEPHAVDVKTAVKLIKDFLQDGEAHPSASLKTLSIPTAVLDEAVQLMVAEEQLQVKAHQVKLIRP